jgi:hypothetical protein
MNNIMRLKEKSIKLLICFSIVFLLAGCSKKKNLGSLSPSRIVKLYYKASNECDVELLRKIIYFPHGTSEVEIKEKIGPSSLSVDGKAAKNMLKIMQMKMAVEYEKILTKDTAEVGVIAKVGIGPLSKRIPGDQIILKRDEGVWKIHYSRGDLTKEQLVDAIRENPQSAWAYYYFGMKTQAENPYKAYRYYQKYYELEPKGFWADRYREAIEAYGDIQKMERIILGSIQNAPKNSDGRAINYVRLSQLFMANNNVEKARKSLDEAKNILKINSCRDKFIIEKYEKARQELGAVESGEYTDILMELEAEDK